MFEVIKTNTSADDYIEKLRSEGYKIIGTGCYASVLAKPRGSTVIKVSMCSSDQSSDGWLNFVSLVLGNPDEKCFPKIYSHAVYKHKRHEYYSVTKIEMLTSLWKFPDNEIKKIMGLKRHKIDNCFSIFKKDKVPKKVWSALKLLKKTYKKSCVSLDIHDGNMMVRVVGNKKTLVFTDPFC